MTTQDWKNSLLLRSFAYGSAFSSAMAETNSAIDPETAAINAQLDELGFDADMVNADLEDMLEADRYGALQSLGVVLPQHA
ncbi:MAG: hypothetical protein HN793_04305 [Rhodospirillaceae bacterium]|jgi:hypothetical protein|nr:hypothetical protein [Rhodospirillaceae bacterium]MBT5240741.1 hypothetical protein [Rhodospirillaceae bacterium]MBT5564069.1 hypothetical protein [Rhodospirillaceae bacterium]MBT6091041.1 hypothetical protein [Rhodospirillaceae bacterium]MBT6961120.1 hypothetical protein [Rhodospirillaceae bacterium]